MFTLSYSVFICMVLLLFTILNSCSYCSFIIILENLWILTFCFCLTLYGYFGSAPVISAAFLSLVVAACEVVSLLTLYLLDESS